MTMELIKDDGWLSDDELSGFVTDALKDRALDGKRVLFIIPDQTRSMPMATMFRALFEALHGRVAKLDYLVALGTHPPLDDAMLNKLVGITAEERNGKYADVGIFNHAWKDPDALTCVGAISEDELVEKYTQERGGKLHLTCGDDGYCVFYAEGCGVHPGRPDVCRAWPFFRGNLVDETSWEMIQEYCPGVNPEVGHAEFVRQGKQYLRDEDLLRYDPDTSPNALVSDD